MFQNCKDTSVHESFSISWCCLTHMLHESLKILTVWTQARFVSIVQKISRVWAGLGGHLRAACFTHLSYNHPDVDFKHSLAVICMLYCTDPVPGCTERAFVQSERDQPWIFQFPSWLTLHSTTTKRTHCLVIIRLGLKCALPDFAGRSYLEECRCGLLSGRSEVLAVNRQDLVALHQPSICVHQTAFNNIGHKYSCVVPGREGIRKQRSEISAVERVSFSNGSLHKCGKAGILNGRESVTSIDVFSISENILTSLF